LFTTEQQLKFSEVASEVADSVRQVSTTDLSEASRPKRLRNSAKLSATARVMTKYLFVHSVQVTTEALKL
jgi:hypothetical protein